MIEIRLAKAGRNLTVRFPEWVDDVEIVFPPTGNNGKGGKGGEPTIILTDRD